MLVNVTTGAQTERLSYDVRRGLLAQEEQPCVGGEPADLSSDLEAMHGRQVDIEQDQIRLQLFGLLNGLQSVRRLDDLESARRCSAAQMTRRNGAWSSTTRILSGIWKVLVACHQSRKHSRRPES